MFKNAVWTLALIGWPDLGLLAINHVVSPGTRVNIIIIIYFKSLRLFLLVGMNHSRHLLTVGWTFFWQKKIQKITIFEIKYFIYLFQMFSAPKEATGLRHGQRHFTGPHPVQRSWQAIAEAWMFQRELPRRMESLRLVSRESRTFLLSRPMNLCVLLFFLKKKKDVTKNDGSR